MMFSSASMISSFSTFVFLKLRRRSNCLVGGRNAKTKDFGRAYHAFVAKQTPVFQGD